MTNHESKAKSIVGLVVIGLAFVVVTSSASACSSETECVGMNCRRVNGGNGDGPGGDADGGPGTGTTAPACTVGGAAHIGLGGVDVAAQYNAPAYVDRARAKPYSALVSEYTRVLGASNTSALLGSAGPTFGDPPDRWYIEPFPSAVLVNTAYNVAFEGCLKLTGDIAGGAADARLAVAPTQDSAKTVCSEWIRKFWSREAAPEQIDDCVSVAMESTSETYGGGSIAEEVRATTPKRQWAYACASVLSATGFLMY